MIHEVMVLDHGGPDLAFILYGSALKLWVLGALLVGVVVPVRSGDRVARRRSPRSAGMFGAGGGRRGRRIVDGALAAAARAAAAGRRRRAGRRWRWC